MKDKQKAEKNDGGECFPAAFSFPAFRLGTKKNA